ncbi:hypothetical protein CFC21_080006 [Triticum aestivum]|uniref:Aminotransferase-like plant mobile domain-containing protein n=2 Tax=Triticum aestivum TaxID=4565 RepID=A0A3B6N0S0_WHEAT|nr:hypothetical protein CFC21_080006 [Triticum aestivum]
MQEFGNVYCSVEKWCELVGKFTPKQRMMLRGTNLDNDISVLNEDVYDIFGLRNEGDDSYDDDFVRRVVLVLMGTVLAPQSTKFVPYRYYKMVEDVNAIKSYNWNNFTLGVCMDAIKKMVEDLEKFKWPIGNLALLQYVSDYLCLLSCSIYTGKKLSQLVWIHLILCLVNTH